MCFVGVLQIWHDQLSAKRVNSRTERRLWLSSHSIWSINHQVSESP